MLIALLMRVVCGPFSAVIITLIAFDHVAVMQAADAVIAGSSKLHPVFRQGLWGYVDNQGKIVIQPQFDSAQDFFDDRAAISSNGNAGFIQPDGSWVIVLPRGTASQRRISEGRVWFRVSGLWGCVSGEDGTVVIPPTYRFVEDFSEGLAAVTEKAPDVAKEEVFDAGLSGFVDRSGRVVIPLQYSSASSFGDGLARIREPLSKSYKYIDQTGKVAFTLDKLVDDPRNYVGSAGKFSEGRAWVAFDGNGQGVPSGVIIDKCGCVVGKSRFDGVRSFSEKLAIFASGIRLVMPVSTAM